MKAVGLRELKNRLAHYVRQARAGGEIQVTDRGEVVAELLPPRSGAGRIDARRGLADLARRGLASLGRSNDPRIYRRMPRRLKRGELRRLIDEERGER
jgi:prevent-host-death family protein